MTVISETEVRPDGTTIYRVIDDSVSVVYDQEQEDASELYPHRIEFDYHESVRLVENPNVVQGGYNSRVGKYNVLLSGTEISRDGETTGQFKYYNLADIRPV